MRINIFGYTVQINKTSDYHDDLLEQAVKLKARSSWKVALVKAMRNSEGLSIKNSLKKVESLFYFDEDGNPIAK